MEENKMPRGRKKKELSIDEQIMKIDLDIKELNDALKNKKVERKKLEKQKEEESISILAEAVEKSGMTVQEVIEMLKS